MLAGDHKNSVLSQVSEGVVTPAVYSAYGYSRVERAGLGFNGELAEFPAGGYLLGMGFRVYNTVLMRFNSPDGFAWSPFGEGGLNGYGYVEGDPVNSVDPSGHLRILGVKLFSTRISVQRPIGDRSVFENFFAHKNAEGQPSPAAAFERSKVISHQIVLNEQGKYGVVRNIQSRELDYVTWQAVGRKRVYSERIVQMNYRADRKVEKTDVQPIFRQVYEIKAGQFNIEALERIGGEATYTAQATRIENIRVPKGDKPKYYK